MAFGGTEVLVVYYSSNQKLMQVAGPENEEQRPKTLIMLTMYCNVPSKDNGGKRRMMAKAYVMCWQKSK